MKEKDKTSAKRKIDASAVEMKKCQTVEGRQKWHLVPVDDLPKSELSVLKRSMGDIQSGTISQIHQTGVRCEKMSEGLPLLSEGQVAVQAWELGRMTGTCSPL